MAERRYTKVNCFPGEKYFCVGDKASDWGRI
jgi:hypothetical protein